MSSSCASESVTYSVTTLTEGVKRPNKKPNTTLTTATDTSEMQRFRLVGDFLDLVSAILALFKDTNESDHRIAKFEVPNSYLHHSECLH